MSRFNLNKLSFKNHHTYIQVHAQTQHLQDICLKVSKTAQCMFLLS